jgi:hypothetical protein
VQVDLLKLRYTNLVGLVWSWAQHVLNPFAGHSLALLEDPFVGLGNTTSKPVVIIVFITVALTVCFSSCGRDVFLPDGAPRTRAYGKIFDTCKKYSV